MDEVDLGGVLAASYAFLAEGVRIAASPWRLLTLGTLAADGGPAMRLVVLRDFHPASRRVALHTDLRSAKCAELRATPRAALHGWDPDNRVQLRLSGRATVEGAGPAADVAWAGLGAHGRRMYDVLPGPGARLQAPDGAMHDTDEAAARAVFAVVQLRFDRLEWLRLPAPPGHGAHRRAVFDWVDGRERRDWLVP